MVLNFTHQQSLAEFNDKIGLIIDAEHCLVRGLAIYDSPSANGFLVKGLYLGADYTTVEHSFIGTDRTGMEQAYAPDHRNLRGFFR